MTLDDLVKHPRFGAYINSKYLDSDGKFVEQVKAMSDMEPYIRAHDSRWGTNDWQILLVVALRVGKDWSDDRQFSDFEQYLKSHPNPMPQ